MRNVAKRSPFYSHIWDLKLTDQAPHWRSLTAYISKIIKDSELDSSLQLCNYNLESISTIAWKLCAFHHRRNFGNIPQFFYQYFQPKGNFKFWWFHLRDLIQIYQNQPYIKFKECFLSIKINFLEEKIKNFSIVLHIFSIYFQSWPLLWIPMIASEKCRHPSDCTRFICKNRLKDNKNRFFKWKSEK